MRMQRGFLNRLREFGADQSGGVAVYVGIGIVVFLGFAGLTIDIGHMVSVKSELQKAADAGALAGARALHLIAPAPNWANGATVATATVQKNKADTNLLTNCTVQTGYWDLAWSASQKAAANLKSTGTIPGPTDVAAIKVTVSKSTGNNGGPVAILFAQVLGLSAGCSNRQISDQGDLTAHAVAVMMPELPVSTIPAGDAFPLATPIGWVQQMWNPDADSATFRIGSAYHDPLGGQWTSFLTDANNVPVIRQLIDSGNPGPLSIGDDIWIEPGTKTTLYADAATRIGDTVLLPIVADDFNTHAETPILAFVPFKITDAEGGSDKYVEGYFVHKYNAPAATGGSAGAPYFGAVGYNAKLVK